MKKVRKAIIPAAGLGTRFLPATKAMPKEMLPIVDKPTIQYIVEEAIESGIEDIIVVTGKGKRAIEDHFDIAFELEHSLAEKGKLDILKKVQQSSNVEIHYIRQKEAKGLGHAVWCARNFIGDEPFAVLLGDDIVESTFLVPDSLSSNMSKQESRSSAFRPSAPIRRIVTASWIRSRNSDVSTRSIVSWRSRRRDKNLRIWRLWADMYLLRRFLIIWANTKLDRAEKFS